MVYQNHKIGCVWKPGFLTYKASFPSQITRLCERSVMKQSHQCTLIKPIAIGYYRDIRSTHDLVVV